MPKSNRDDFTPRTRIKIGRRAGWRCSYLSCGRETDGATSDGRGEISIGVAAHICAAAPGGPRYDVDQTSEARRSADNGIWMCEDHANIIDFDDPRYTVELLRQWKAQAQVASWRRVLREPAAKIAAPSEGELNGRLRAAVRADLEVFRRSDRWPSTAVPLLLQIEGISEPVSPSALATALATLDDLVVVAAPGMGKTTVLFQTAEAVLAAGSGSPILVPLGDWASDDVPLFESVLKRHAYRGLSDDDIRAAAAKPGVILLLDGWNELDAASRKRLTPQVKRLQAELPNMRLLISTRTQALDVPVDGARVQLLPLARTQQVEIARSLRGDAGVRMIDQARRVSGVRELITIPLYLRALLSLSEGAPLPTTKEALLRAFVAVHEQDPQRAQALAEVAHGVHQRLLESLATTAIRELNTTIAEDVARRCIAEAEDSLVREGQLTQKPQPNTVLEALVNHHALTRVREPPGYSFQHQQIQEWYASHFAERLIVAGMSDARTRAKLMAEILDQPAWEESILFTCERLARGASGSQDACAAAILAAFEVDPMLAADKIFRATDAVWARVAVHIQQQVTAWHRPGTVDRAVRFMLTSGRPEFFELIWPLITHERQDVRVRTVRACRRFRPSVLGRDAAERIAQLPPEVRKVLLSEIVHRSGVDGLDLATDIAKHDPDSEVRAEVVDALAFRRADQQVAEVLCSADEKTWDVVARHDLLDEVPDERVKARLEEARVRQAQQALSPQARLQRIIRAPSTADRSAEVTTIVAEIEITKEGRQAVAYLLDEARNRYMQSVAEGLLKRVREGRTLFYGASDLLAGAGFSLEDDELLRLALADTKRDDRAEAAVSVLGPHAMGRVIDAVLECRRRVRDESGAHNQAASDRYNELLTRVKRARSINLLAAVQARSSGASNADIAELANLISHHPQGRDGGRSFDAEGRAAIAVLASDWGNRMLSGGDATRYQLAAVAELATRARTADLLPLLKRLLDEELRRREAFRAEANKIGWRSGAEATDEARMSYSSHYRWAFEAINTPGTTALMRAYLRDEGFGEEAAQVLARQWETANEPPDKGRFGGWRDLLRLVEKRAVRERDPDVSCDAADAIFSAVEALTVEGAFEPQKKQALTLAVIAARLPHGRRDATIKQVIELAPRRSRAALLQSLVSSGEVVDIEVVKDGIAEVFEAAKSQAWILHERYNLSQWLDLLPFTNRLGEAFAVIRDLPANQRRPSQLEDVITALGFVPGMDAEDVLFRLAESDPAFYGSHRWRDAVLARGSVSAARRYIDLAAKGVFDEKGGDRWHLAREISPLIAAHPELRVRVYQLLRDGVPSPAFEVLAQAVAEQPDVEGLLLLVEIEIKSKRRFASWRTIESIVSAHEPVEGAQNTYTIVPVPASSLRKSLLAMTTDGGVGDVAAYWLGKIDDIRDEYGMPESEPRHPDLSSGKPWPIMTPATE